MYNFFFALFLAFAMSSYVRADSWRTVEQDPTLGCSVARSMAEDTNRNLYAIGSASADCKIHTWIVKKSVDHGATWNIIDSFAPDKKLSSEPASITIGSKNSFIVVGKSEYKAKTGETLTRLITRISTNGQIFKTKDKVEFPSLSWTRGSGVTADKSGTIYTLGSVQEGYINAKTPWECHCRLFLRKSSDLGKTWSTQTIEENHYLWAVSLASTPTGDLIVTAQAQTDPARSTSFLVLKSSDQGQTWNHIDEYSLYQKGAGSHITTLHVTKNGVIFTAGLAAQTLQSSKHWLVRKSNDGGAHWLTIDDYSGDGSEYLWPESIFESETGELFVGGYRYNDHHQVNWVVRKWSNDRWMTSDDFTSANKNAGAAGIFGDSATGQIFVMGFTDGFWTLKTN